MYCYFQLCKNYEERIAFSETIAHWLLREELLKNDRLGSLLHASYLALTEEMIKQYLEYYFELNPNDDF
jgi:hypothetical protein